MTGQNDAELSVGINDNLTPVLAKMAAQTRAFGNAIGAEAGKIDKAVAQVTKSIHNLGTGAGVNPSSSHMVLLRKQAEALTTSLREQEAIMARLNRARSVTTDSQGRTRGADGRFISQESITAYQNASRAAADYRTRLEGLDETLRRNASVEQAAAAATNLRAERIRAMGPSLQRENELLAMREHMLNNMGSTIQRSWWPPEMLRGPQQFTEAMMGMQNSVRYAMYDISRNLFITGAALTALGVGAVVVAAQWERAFADVERTVQGTPATLESIRQGLVGLSQDIPVAFKDLSQIASIGGQMGITASGIVAYTETIAKLTATTNLTADAASKALGRFKAFFAEANDPSLAVTDQTFSNLASSILKVGVNSVATESGIVNVATQISSMGSYAGFTADQVIGLSGALSSVGVPPELSRGVITRLFTTIGEAVNEGGVRLNDFAQIAGVSSKQFSEAWGTQDFAYIFTDLINGIGQLDNGVATLHELGITSVRDVPVLLRLAGAADELGRSGGLLAQTMNDARSGWRQNIELSLQYNKIADTLVERTKVLMQNFEALFATVGQSSVGPVKNLVDGIITLVKGFTTLASTPAGQWLGGVAIAASVLTGALLLLAAGGARAFAAMQGLATGLQSVGISSTAAATGVRVLSIAMAGLGAIGAIAAIVGTVVALTTATNEANNAIQDTSGALAAMKLDAQKGFGTEMTQGFASAKREATGLSSQADNLGRVLGFTEDKMYGNAAAADEAGASMERTALRYGKTAAAFARSAVTSQKAFTDLFDGEFGQGFADRIVANGFDLDKALKIAATKDRDAVKAYVEEVFGRTFSEEQLFTWNVNPDKVFDLELNNRAATLFSILTQTGEGMKTTARQAYALGDAFTGFSSAANMTTEAMDEFKVANEDAINSMAEGFAKFVDTSSLIGLTQEMRAAFDTIDDGSTEVNEHADAIAGFEQAWTDAYGGAKFSIDDYMNVFRRAAGEQQTFIANLQELAARGVPTDIIGDLAAMGPQAQALVEALVNSTDAQLDEYVTLYTQTGFDAMVGLAAGQLAAEQIVRNAAKTLSSAQLRQLSADLAAGTPLTDAMAKWQLDAQGKPLAVEAKAEMDWYAQQRYFQSQAAKLGFSIPITPYLTATRLKMWTSPGGDAANLTFAGGGYTGPGGMYEPAGTVHRGEYVHPKRDVDQSTGLPKPEALMRMLNGRVATRRGGNGGYAAGGYVTGSTAAITHLSVEDRMLLIQIRDAVGLTISQSTVASLANADNTNGTTRRSS